VIAIRTPPVGLALATLAMLAAVAVVAAATAAPAQPSGDGERLLHDAQTANAHQSYTGVLSVDWTDGVAQHHTEASTHVVDGEIEVGGGSSRILSEGDQRWIGAPGSWALVVGSDSTAAAPPSAETNWDLRTGPGPTVAGRATTAVVASDPSNGTPRARFFIDTGTGILLRRDVLDPRGHLVRDVSFEAFLPLGDTHAPGPPQTAKPEEPATLRSVPSGYDAPSSIGRGYRLLGRYRQPDGTIQLYYGDGIFTLSLFEQQGTIDWGSLPSGTSLTMNGDQTRVYETAASSVAVWSHHGLIVTAVSDAAPDELLGAARRVTRGGGGGGALHDVAHFVLGPFGWD
jgi:negative regulator of sigma E activity